MGKKGKNKRSKRGHGSGKRNPQHEGRGEKRRAAEIEVETGRKAKKLRLEATVSGEGGSGQGTCAGGDHHKTDGKRSQDDIEAAGIEEERLKKLCIRTEEDISVFHAEGLVEGSETKMKKKHKKKKRKEHEKTREVEDTSAGEGDLGSMEPTHDVIAPQTEGAEKNHKPQADVGHESEPTSTPVQLFDTKHKTAQKEMPSQETRAVLHLTLNNLEEDFGQEHVQQLLLHAFLGKRKSAPWCQIQNFNKLKKVVLVILNGLSEHHLTQYPECFAQLAAMFSNKKVPLLMKVADPRSREFMRNLLRVPVSKTAQKKLGKDLENGTVHPSLIESSTSCAKDTEEAQVGRTHYLLSKEQLKANRFPLDTNTALPEDFVSMQCCTPTNASPMFAVDCEMCETDAGKELTRVSVVNEELKTVFNSLVKPWRPVRDHMTQFSGISAADLKDVTTRLDHVQETMLELLPPDAILVGHSLENDLQALKMIHPHVIDTSLLFNHPTWRFKPKLRTLTSKLLGKEIQTGTGGHDSVEDAVAAMQLAQLKISKGPGFLLDNGGHNTVSNTESYFRVLAREKKVATMVDQASLLKPFLGNPVHCIPVVSDREALTKARNEIKTKHFVWVQLHSWNTVSQGSLSDESILQETLTRLTARVRELYEMVPTNSLFMLLTTGAHDFDQAKKSSSSANTSMSQESVPSEISGKDGNQEMCSRGLCYVTIKKC